jgi:hypothetical protein
MNVAGERMAKLDPPRAPLRPNEWQEYCTQVLKECVSEPIATRAQSWTEERWRLIQLSRQLIADEKQQRVLIADARFHNEDLTGFDFSYCYIVRCSFRKSKLSYAKFGYAILRCSELNDADIRAVSFFKSDLKEVTLTDVIFDRHTNWNLAGWDRYGDLSDQLADRIDRDRARWANRKASLIVRALNYATDHGFGVRRVAISCAAAPLVFGVLYWVLDRSHFAVAAGKSTPEALTLWNFVLLSLERFVSGSPWIFGVSPLAHFLTAFETLLGLLLLGLLIAMLVRQIVRK